MILLFDFKNFERNHRHLLSTNFFVDTKIDEMDSCFFYFKCDDVKIRLVDNIKKGKYDYLRPEGEIVLTMNTVFNVFMLDINFDGLFVNSVRVWHKADCARHSFQCWLERI